MLRPMQPEGRHMSATLPEPLSAYFAAKNRHDIDAMLAPFSADAVVKDEGRERRGRAAIREWMEETTRKYRDTVEVTGAIEADGSTVVTGLVSGSFPGSPAVLHFAFTLEGGKVVRLEIG
jgi:ketosteroid isomerase-like protein